MIIAPLHRHFSAAHLEDVRRDMARLGPPLIRAYFDATTGCWLAREGTHRIRAAHQLRVSPVMVHVPWWRSQAALERARWAALDYGYQFPDVPVAPRVLGPK